MAVVVLLSLAGLMHAAGTYSGGVGAHPTGEAALAAGFMLLVAFFSGKVFSAVRLPKLTGYIAAGIVFGPSVLGLVSDSMVVDLKLVNGVAVALIALTAGGEMDFRAIRPLLGVIVAISLIAVLGTAALLMLAVFLLRDMLPLFDGMTTTAALAIAAVLGVTIVAQSPAVVVALRDETEADGPVTQVVLGVVVIADLLVIIMFALASSFAQSVLGETGAGGGAGARVAWELFGSLAAGVLTGLVLAVYLRYVTGSVSMFLLAVAIVIAEVGSRLHLDPLLVALAAGMLVKNATNVSERMIHDLEAAALPVYVLFFAVAGATIHLDVLPVVWLPAIILIAVRTTGFLVGARAAAALVGAADPVRRYAGFGLLPQAGLALALAMLFARTFPSFGEAAAALTLGIVAINEIVAPAVFRWVLVRSGEAGSRVRAAPPREAVATDAPGPAVALAAPDASPEQTPP
jgi:Kef-type K+ transport system membrane component KefB